MLYVLKNKKGQVLGQTTNRVLCETWKKFEAEKEMAEKLAAEKLAAEKKRQIDP
jgi:hypothetical protein